MSVVINHLRTLLLNQAADPSGLMPGIPGEEFVQPGYGPLALPANLLMLQIALFGTGYDRAMANYRLREILSVAHATELAPYMTQLDPRITYWPPHEARLFRAGAFGANALQVSGATCSLSFQGNLNQFLSPNLLLGWSVVVSAGNNVQATQTAGGQGSYSGTYALTNGLSNPIPLPGSNLSVVFATLGNPLPTWNIAALARPSYPLLQVLGGLQTAGADALFVGAEEPYATLRALWGSGTLSVPYRIAAAAIALGYRINDVWKGLV